MKTLTYQDALWSKVADYAEKCSWQAGAILAKLMKSNSFSDYERVFAVMIENEIAGYCALSKTDCIPNVPYTPYISFIFVGEPYRGKRISKKLCLFAIDYAHSIGFNEIFLVSDHINLYEKYGFKKVDEKKAPWGTMETIFMYSL